MGISSGAAGVGLVGAGAVVSAIGAYGSANAQKTALGSQAGQFDTQAYISTVQGKMAEANGNSIADTAILNANTSAVSGRISARATADSSLLTSGYTADMATLNAGTAAKVAQMTGQSVAQMAAINAQAAELNAEQALFQGDRVAQSVMLKGGQVKASQRTSMAASGIDLGSDTAVRNLTSTDVITQSDTNTIQANALRQAFGYRTEAVNYTNQGVIAKAGADVTSLGATAQGDITARSARTAGQTTAEMSLAQGETNAEMATAQGFSTATTARAQGKISDLMGTASAIGFRASAATARAGASGISPWMAAGTSLLGSAAAFATSQYLGKKSGSTLAPVSANSGFSGWSFN